jgi:hypothetical protein
MRYPKDPPSPPGGGVPVCVPVGGLGTRIFTHPKLSIRPDRGPDQDGRIVLMIVDPGAVMGARGLAKEGTGGGERLKGSDQVAWEFVAPRVV